MENHTITTKEILGQHVEANIASSKGSNGNIKQITARTVIKAEMPYTSYKMYSCINQVRSIDYTSKLENAIGWYNSTIIT